MTPIPLEWPPTLASYKTDLKLDEDDDRFDDALQGTLDAAVAYVERVRDDVDYLAYAAVTPTVRDVTLTALTMDHVIGTLRLARRWDLRRDTPTAMLLAGTVGSTGMATWDPDVEKQLRIGRYARMRFA